MAATGTKGVRWRSAVRQVLSRLASRRATALVYKPSAVALSSSSPKQAYWAYLFSAALWAYWAFAGLHPGPTTGWVSSRMQAALAQ